MPAQLPSPNDIIQMKDRRSWRMWLEKNHDRKQSVWILFPKKHTSRRSVVYTDAVEEALCFGWIDSQVRRVDEDVYIQKFTPRRRKSAWSPSNKQRVRKLVRLGLMTPVGLAKVAEAKKDGSWTTLDAVEKLESTPRALKEALGRNAGAGKNFRNLSPTLKKQFLWFIASAKREGTRTKRIAIVVRLLARNRTMSDHFYGKDRK
jgi:uncharacterized protein YdeI (YjbR/CyaY-like superfamily)